jgi:hypothetical protein
MGPSEQVPPEDRDRILSPNCSVLTWGTRRHVTSIKTKHRKPLNREPSLVLALTKIRPRIEVLAIRNKLNRLINGSHNHINNDNILNHIILLCYNTFVPLLLLLCYYYMPIAVGERSRARTVFARSNTAIVGSNPT